MFSLVHSTPKCEISHFCLNENLPIWTTWECKNVLETKQAPGQSLLLGFVFICLVSSGWCCGLSQVFISTVWKIWNELSNFDYYFWNMNPILQHYNYLLKLLPLLAHRNCYVGGKCGQVCGFTLNMCHYTCTHQLSLWCNVC